MHVLIGAALVLLSAVYTGFTAAVFYKRRLLRLEAFLALICHIEAQIEGYLTPLESIFSSYDDKRLTDIDFCGIAAEKGGAEAIRLCAGRLYLNPDEAAELCTFFDGLGKGTAAEEIRHCRYFEKRFSKLCAEASSELPGKIRICRGLGILIGIMVVIILL